MKKSSPRRYQIVSPVSHIKRYQWLSCACGSLQELEKAGRCMLLFTRQVKHFTVGGLDVCYTAARKRKSFHDSQLLSGLLVKEESAGIL